MLDLPFAPQVGALPVDLIAPEAALPVANIIDNFPPPPPK